MTKNDERVFRDAYDASLSAPSQAALYRSTPVVYMYVNQHTDGMHPSPYEYTVFSERKSIVY